MPPITSPAIPSSRQDPAGRQEQLRRQQPDPDQRDDDERFHYLDYAPPNAYFLMSASSSAACVLAEPGVDVFTLGVVEGGVGRAR